MVSICANSTCGAPFRYLRAGKLVAVTSSHSKNSCPHSVEHFWLCDSCSQRYDLRITAEGSVELVARESDSPQGAELDSQPLQSQGARLLQALRFELDFLDRGGYRKSGQWSFAEPSFFEDSPVCSNAHEGGNRIPCRDCILTTFIPRDRSESAKACHFIPLDEKGSTVFSLQQTGADHIAVESKLRSWLREQIASLSRKAA